MIWREKNRKYSIGTPQTGTWEINENTTESVYHWVTEHGSCHTIQDGDYWMEFPFLETSRVYN